MNLSIFVHNIYQPKIEVKLLIPSLLLRYLNPLSWFSRTQPQPQSPGLGFYSYCYSKTIQEKKRKRKVRYFKEPRVTPPTPLPSTTHLTRILTLLAGPTHLLLSFLIYLSFSLHTSNTPLCHSLISFHGSHSIAPPPSSFFSKDHRKTPEKKGKAHSSLKEFISDRDDSPIIFCVCHFTRKLLSISLSSPIIFGAWHFSF